MKPDSPSPVPPEPTDAPPASVPPKRPAAPGGDHRAEPPPRATLWGMLSLSAPMVAIQTTQVVMQFTDAYMVKWLGAEALAAALPAGLFYFIPVAFAMGLLGGVNTFVSQCLGKNWRPGCGHYAWQGILLALVYGVALLALWPLTPYLFGWLKHEPDVQALEEIYFRISLFGGGAFLVLQAMSSFYIGIHRTALLLWFALGGALLNIVLNYVLIFGHWGFPELGFAGAAWGTVFATMAQATALFLHFITGERARVYRTRVIRLEWRAQGELIRVGAPMGFQFLFDLMSWGVALVWLVGWFGTAQLAATTIAVRYMHLSFMPAAGVGQVLTAMVGRSIGAGDPELAGRHVVLALRLCMGYMGVMALLFLVFRVPLVEFFVTPGEAEATEIVRIGAGVMVIAAVFQIFDALAIVMVNALRGAGDTLWPALVTGAMCLGVFVAGGLVVATQVPGLESWGPWLMGMVYIILLSVALGLRWAYGPWRQINIFAGRDA